MMFGDKTLIGQHISWALDGFEKGYERHVIGFQNRTGVLPSIIGVDFGIHLSRANLDDVVPELIKWDNSGGIVQADFHANNPWTGKSYSDTTRGLLSDLYEPGTVCDAWHATLDEAAYGLTMLRDAGAPVLWRPFHEAAYNGSFWWGTRTEFAEFKRAWWDMYEYLAGVHNLDNLRWVYSAANTDNWLDVLEHYPGNAFADVVGIDVYSDYVNIRGDGYHKMLTTGLPFVLTECGPGTKLDGTFDATYIAEAIKRNYPSTVYFQAWHSDVWNSDPSLWKLRALVDMQRVEYLVGMF